MEKVPMISVIMPAYNATKYLEEAVQSVIRQTFDDWELLIIDDCSRDETYQLMQKLQKRDSRIRILQNAENCGVAKTRNYGVSQARGEWVAFLDSDDRWDPSKLEKQVALIRSNPEIEFTFTGSAYIEDDGMSISYELHVPGKVSRKRIMGRNIISCSSVVLKKKLMEEHPMQDNREIHEDFAAWLEILKDVPYAYGVDEPLLIYRRALASKSGKKSKSAVMNWNTYEVSGINGILRILCMMSYTFFGLVKYAHLRFYSYNQMLRKERLKNLFLFVMTIILLAGWTASFSYVWLHYYNYKHVINGTFVFWGHVAMLTIYFFANVVVGKAFSAFRIIYQTRQELILSQIFTTIIVNVFTLLELALIGRWDFAKLTKYAPYMVGVFVVNLIIAMIWSAVVRWLYATIYPPHDMLLISGDESTAYLEKMLLEQKKQYRVNDRISLKEERSQIEKEIMKHESVILGEMAIDERNYYIKFCYENKKRCYCHTSIIDILIMGADRVFLSDIPLNLYKNCGMTIEQRIMKRILDVILSLLALILLSPLYLVLALIIKIVSKESAFQTQICLTKNGKKFKQIKFRTSTKEGAAIPALAWIKNSNLDELPQLFCVLKGDMSLVGPYPETIKMAEANRDSIPEAFYRQEVKAGLTGYAQVYGKFTTSQMNKLKMDIYYIHNYSLGLDINLIAMTVKVLFFR